MDQSAKVTAVPPCKRNELTLLVPIYLPTGEQQNDGLQVIPSLTSLSIVTVLVFKCKNNVNILLPFPSVLKSP